MNKVLPSDPNEEFKQEQQGRDAKEKAAELLEQEFAEMDKYDICDEDVIGEKEL